MSALVKNIDTGATVATLTAGTGRVLRDGEFQDTPPAGDNYPAVVLRPDHLVTFQGRQKLAGLRNG